MRMSELTQAAEARMESQAETRLLASPEQEWVRRFAPRRSSQEDSPELMSVDHLFVTHGRTPESAIIELERLLSQMAPDDIERLLDYARRLAR
jgi:hypothetical protein